MKLNKLLILTSAFFLASCGTLDLTKQNKNNEQTSEIDNKGNEEKENINDKDGSNEDKNPINNEEDPANQNNDNDPKDPDPVVLKQEYTISIDFSKHKNDAGARLEDKSVYDNTLELINSSYEDGNLVKDMSVSGLFIQDRLSKGGNLGKTLCFGSQKVDGSLELELNIEIVSIEISYQAYFKYYSYTGAEGFNVDGDFDVIINDENIEHVDYEENLKDETEKHNFKVNFDKPTNYIKIESLASEYYAGRFFLNTMQFSYLK